MDREAWQATVHRAWGKTESLSTRYTYVCTHTVDLLCYALEMSTIVLYSGKLLKNGLKTIFNVIFSFMGT